MAIKDHPDARVAEQARIKAKLLEAGLPLAEVDRRFLEYDRQKPEQPGSGRDRRGRSRADKRSGPRRFLDTAANADLLVREPHIDPAARALCAKRYQTANPKLVDLSFAGRLPVRSRSLSSLRNTAVGDAITLAADKDRWMVKDRDGAIIGRMSRAFSPPDAATFLSGEVGAMLRWRKSDSGEDYRHLVRRDEWDVVLPEFVFQGNFED